ncbi:MAG: 16S rRNA (cytosine(967)-C(5))-methyltransferase RsmB [Clostridia bacterium]|nr:16S rRNA (cytosine(967)-C(5))-methyltransferase RsmB [Clostridia bacterium]
MAVKGKVNVRDAIVNSLMRTTNGSKFSNLELDSALKKYELSQKDRALFTAIYYGVIERRLTLDTIIGRLSSRPIEKIDPRTLEILRVALYQLRFMDRIPAHAAVSSAVDLTRKGGTDSFVNAVLRAYLRSPDDFEGEKMGLCGAELLSYKYSVPVWLVESWTRDYGYETAERIAAESCSRPTVTLRVNILRSSADEICREITEAGIECEAVEGWENAVRLLSSCPLEELSPLSDGRAYVQDMASQYASAVLAPAPGETVLDVCACPGGKSFSAAMHMENKGRVLSFDLHRSKLSLIDKGAEKLGINIIETAERDGRIFAEEYDGIADRIICDVPCSGLGVISKKPEIRYKDPGDINRLPEIQSAILENCSRYLKVGGTLVYSTCTLSRAENDDVYDRFISSSDCFVPEEFEVGGYRSLGGKLTLFPFDGTDGFFISKIKRVK